MDGRVMGDSQLEMTADDACLNVVYKEEIDDDNLNNNDGDSDNNDDNSNINDDNPNINDDNPNNNDEGVNAGDNNEYIIVTVDENQSLDSFLSNLGQHPQLQQQLHHQLQQQLPRDIVIFTSGEERIDQDSLDKKVYNELPSSPELFWSENGEIQLRKVSDDEDVENTVPQREQIIYVNSEDLVASDPSEQYIVIEDGIPLASPSPIQYAIATRASEFVSTEAPEMRALMPDRQIITDYQPARHVVCSAEQTSSMATSSTSSISSTVTSLSPSSNAAKSQRTVFRKVAPKPKKTRVLKRKFPGDPRGHPNLELPLDGDQSKDFQCTLCKAYTYDLKSHLKLHCDVCNVFMKDPELLKTHKLNHTKSVGHCSCGICGEKFASSELLRGHLQINGYHRSSFSLPAGSTKKVQTDKKVVKSEKTA